VDKEGVDLLLNAMPTIILEYPACKLLIAGDGPIKEKLIKQTKELGVSSAVQFLGRYKNNELPLLYGRADIAVFPFQVAKGGDQEGLGLVTIEAMGCGLPVVVGNVPAVADVVQHNENGLICPLEDHSCLAQSILHLLKDEKLARRLAENGKLSVTCTFDWIKVADSYSDILLGTLK
jgi:glycosyltransferase involved in cell wall biosynthesis